MKQHSSFHVLLFFLMMDYFKQGLMTCIGVLRSHTCLHGVAFDRFRCSTPRTPTSFTELAGEGEQDVGEFCSAEKRGCLAHSKQSLSLLQMITSKCFV